MTWQTLTLAILWSGFFLYWFIASLGVPKNEKSARPALDRVHHVVVAGTLILVLLGSELPPPLSRQLWSWPAITGWTGVLAAMSGLCFAVWARGWLGEMWSATVALKHDHKLIETGPYALVRHPIYAGILLGYAASMMVAGTLAAVAGFVLVSLSYAAKILREEKFLRAQLGRDYEDYAKRVKAIIPGVL